MAGLSGIGRLGLANRLRQHVAGGGAQAAASEADATPDSGMAGFGRQREPGAGRGIAGGILGRLGGAARGANAAMGGEPSMPQRGGIADMVGGEPDGDEAPAAPVNRGIGMRRFRAGVR